MVKINKNTISDFALSSPLVAMATKSKLFDTSFCSTSELILYNYKLKVQTVTKSEHKFCCIKWCELSKDNIFLISGHENGYLSIYKYDESNNTLNLSQCKQFMESTDDVVDLDFFLMKKMLCAVTNTGKTYFISLTDFKDYFLEIRVDNPTCITWNKNVSKILAIGTANGIVKLIDIKKNNVLMTSGGFQNIKQVLWDDACPTKLLIQSEKNFITEHELSNDLRKEYCLSKQLEKSEDTPITEITGFTTTMLATENCIIDLKTKTKHYTAPMRNATIYKNMACLHLQDGTTEVISIPRMPVRRGFIRVEDRVFVNNAKTFKVTSKRTLDNSNQDDSTEMDDAFYEELPKQKDIYDYLLSNAHSIPECFKNKTGKNTVHVDAVEHSKLIQGDYSDLENSIEKVDLKLLHAILTNDTQILSTISSFPTLLLMSKLLNDYSELRRLDNSRILAAILIKHNLDMNILNESDKEGRIIKGILTNDSAVVSDRIVLNNNYYSNIYKIQKYLSNLDTYIESDYLTEYFWYMVSQGKYEEVKELKVNDIKVGEYKESKKIVRSMHLNLNTNMNMNTNNNMSMNSGMYGRNNNMNNMNQINNTMSSKPTSFIRAPENKMYPTSPKGNPLSSNNMSSMNNPMRGNNMNQMSNPMTNTPMTNNQMKSPVRNTPMPPNPMNNQMNPSNPQMKRPPMLTLQMNINSSMRTPPRPNNGMANTGMSGNPMNQLNNSAMKTPGTPMMRPPMSNQMSNSMNSNTARPHMPMPSRPGMSQMGSSNQMGNNSMNTPMNGPARNQFTPPQPNNNNSNQQGMMNKFKNINAPGNNNMSNMSSNNISSMSNNSMSRPPMNRMPMTPSGMQRPMGNMGNNNMGSSMGRPPMSNNGMTNNQMSNNFDNNLNNGNIQASAYVNNSNNYVDAPRILNDFNQLINMLKQKAATINSVILNNKKNKALAQIQDYERMDKNSIDQNTLMKMSEVVSKMNNISSNLKYELEILVQGDSPSWLKAVTELIKISY